MRSAAMHPDRVALDWSGNALTYAELAAGATSAAGALRAKGVCAGDRVGLALRSGAELVMALHACTLIGAVAVPIDLRLGTAERAVRAMAPRSSLALRSSTKGPPSRSGSSRRTATVMHTSGTTAMPRPVSAHSPQLARECVRLRGRARTRPGGAVALPAAARARRGVVDPDSQRDLWHDGGAARAFDAEPVAAALSDPAKRITLVSLVPRCSPGCSTLAC